MTNDQRSTTTLWSGRFDVRPDAAALAFGASFRFDRRLFPDDVTGSLAWARALARAGVLSRDDARAIEGTLAEILQQGLANPDFVSSGGSSNGLATPAGGCTPDDRGTSRCRSICAST
jgi:hypothetical protein